MKKIYVGMILLFFIFVGVPKIEMMQNKLNVTQGIMTVYAESAEKKVVAVDFEKVDNNDNGKVDKVVVIMVMDDGTVITKEVYL